MDPFIQNWAQSADAQPYLQQVMGAQGGYGMGGVDPYSQYLMQLINANPQDVGFQDQLLGYYLDYTNPMNQQRPYVDENKLNTALSLLSSDNPDYQMWGESLLGSMYPQVGEQTQAPAGLSGYQATALQNMYTPMAEVETDPEKLYLYSLLASGDEDARSAYYSATPSFWDRVGAWALPFGKNWWNAEAGTGTREKAVRSAYGF